MPLQHNLLPRLYMVTYSRFFSDPEQELPALISQLTSRTEIIIQLREKHLDARTVRQLGLQLRSSMQKNGSLLFINERSDIAIDVGADGVHLPENSCPLEATRKICPGMFTGKSVHSVQSAIKAEEEGADYLMFGPVFDTPLKRPYGPPQGLKKLRALCNATAVPVFAIGGITPENAARCMDEGAYGLAAMSLFHNADNLPAVIASFQSILNSKQS